MYPDDLHLPCSSEEINPTNSSFGSQSSTLRQQRNSLYPSQCSGLEPYSSCWGGFKATVAGGNFMLTSTGASSCPTGSGVFAGGAYCIADIWCRGCVTSLPGTVLMRCCCLFSSVCAAWLVCTARCLLGTICQAAL